MATSASRIAAPSDPRHRAATLEPASYREADGSFEVVWTTGAAVTRLDWYDGEYYDETLSTAPSAVRLDRLNAGAPVVASHETRDLTALLGSVVPGTARMVEGQGIARIRLAETPDVADLIAKVRAGHLRNVSVGYRVHTYERHEPGQGGRVEMRAVDWEPEEISLVAVPADPGCQIRSRTDPMTEVITADPAQVEATRARGAVTAADITRACAEGDTYSRAFERELLAEHAERPFTRAALVTRLTEEYAKVTGALTEPLDNNVTTRRGDRPDRAAGMARAMEDALYARLSGAKPSDDAREFMGASMIDIARGLLEARGERARWLSPGKVLDTMARYGAHTTSDFPTLMGNASARYLLDIFNTYPSPLKAITKPRTAKDFRAITVAKVGQNPQLLSVAENGEIKRGGVVETAEGYRLGTYARIFAITRQALINDDLGAFASVFEGWGRSAAELEASTIVAIITGNKVMGDSNALFSAAHGNLAASGGAITVPTLSAARLAMRSQKDVDGTTPTGVIPKYLVVGAAKETEAEQALAALTAQQPNEVNPFSGKLELLVDPRLPGNAWRLFADPLQSPVIEIARLAGQEDVFVDTRVGFDIDGIESKARLDIGGGAVDWRGAYMNPGD